MPTESAHHHKVEHPSIRINAAGPPGIIGTAHSERGSGFGPRAEPENQIGSTPTTSRRQRVLQIALVATICAIATVGCGSARPNKSGDGLTGQGKYAGALAFGKCMRSHGVPDFPDPKATGNGILVLGYSPGLNSQSPAFSSAQQPCKHLLPGAGSPNQHQIAQAKAELLAVSHCMRAHSISSFRDPTTSRPPNRVDYNMIIAHDGALLAIPNSIAPTSPAFKQAAAACSLGLPTADLKAPNT